MVALQSVERGRLVRERQAVIKERRTAAKYAKKRIAEVEALQQADAKEAAKKLKRREALTLKLGREPTEGEVEAAKDQEMQADKCSTAKCMAVRGSVFSKVILADMSPLLLVQFSSDNLLEILFMVAFISGRVAACA